MFGPAVPLRRTRPDHCGEPFVISWKRCVTDQQSGCQHRTRKALEHEDRRTTPRIERQTRGRETSFQDVLRKICCDVETLLPGSKIRKIISLPDTHGLVDCRIIMIITIILDIPSSGQIMPTHHNAGLKKGCRHVGRPSVRPSGLLLFISIPGLALPVSSVQCRPQGIGVGFVTKPVGLLILDVPVPPSHPAIRQYQSPQQAGGCFDRPNLAPAGWRGCSEWSSARR